MTVEELRDVLWNIVSEYFKGAVVRWSETKGVKSAKPLITLNLNNIVPTQHYINDEENGEQIAVKPFSASLEVQLFTHGRKQTDNSGGVYYINTAVSDMVSFSHYMLSELVAQRCDNYNIALRTDSPVNDISAVVDTAYEYRAMQQYIVSFLGESRGKAGVSPFGEEFTPTASGGGTQQLAAQQTGVFENVGEIKEEYN